jgi:cell wall-associated NlpC family hydrolase
VSRAAPDPRLTPARPDLAAAKLRGIVAAPAYADGRVMHVAAEIADVRHAPTPEAPVDTQALHGETVTVYDERDGFAWAQLEGDGYVGYIAATALREGARTPTHRVAVTRTLLYPRPDIKAPSLGALPLGAALRATAVEGLFARLDIPAFVFAAHLVASGTPAPDFVAVAEGFLGAPYLWGGKSALGLDCSGLVQLALREAGVAAPRDTDMQAQAVGTAQPVDANLRHLRRGDLVFWRGHVGVMRDMHELLHANAHHMRVASEPLAVARARIAANGAGDIIAIRRPTR